MTVRESRGLRRAWVLTNYLSILSFLGVWYGVPDSERVRPAWLALITVLLALAALSFVAAHLRTGLWRLVHPKPGELDEREIQLTLGALRYAYAALAILCLTLLLAQAVAGERGILLFDAVLPAVLIYVAHTLPAAVIGWTEREV